MVDALDLVVEDELVRFEREGIGTSTLAVVLRVAMVVSVGSESMAGNTSSFYTSLWEEEKW